MGRAIETCTMIGLGYIGLPMAAVIARSGIKVVGVDVNKAIVEYVNAGRCPIKERELPELIAAVVAAGRLRAQTTPARGDVFIIAVPTPLKVGYRPDLSFVEAAARSIAPVLAKGNLVIVESTVPLGATEQVVRWLEQTRPDLSFSQRSLHGGDHGQGNDRADGETGIQADVLVAHCPERILPGQMLRELVENDRVIGGVCAASAVQARAFYKMFVAGQCLIADSRTAELCKLSENAFRDVNIAFANELAMICDQSNINVWRLIELANHHPRVNILKPGPGVGGHCIAVDPWFIVSALDNKTRLIREARRINGNRPRLVAREALDHLRPGRNTGRIGSIACFGLAYKANIGDLRESPALEIVALIAKELHDNQPGVQLLVVEPHLDALPEAITRHDIARLVDIDEALGADLIVMLVDHKEFLSIPVDRVRGKIFVDTRGVWAGHGIAAT